MYFKCEATKKKLQLVKNIKRDFCKNFLYNVKFYQILMLFKFLKISYVLLETTYYSYRTIHRKEVSFQKISCITKIKQGKKEHPFFDVTMVACNYLIICQLIGFFMFWLLGENCDHIIIQLYKDYWLSTFRYISGAEDEMFQNLHESVDIFMQFILKYSVALISLWTKMMENIYVANPARKLTTFM